MEHVHNRQCMPITIMKSHGFSKMGWGKRHTCWTRNLFAMLCLIYSTGSIAGFNPCAWETIEGLKTNETQYREAKRFAEYLTSHYAIISNTPDKIKIAITVESTTTANVKQWWENYRSKLNRSGVFSQEFLYSKVAAKIKLEQSWVQGVPFPFVLHVDKLIHDMSPALYQDYRLFLCQSQKQHLLTNSKLNPTTEDPANGAAPDVVVATTGTQQIELHQDVVVV